MPKYCTVAYYADRTYYVTAQSEKEGCEVMNKEQEKLTAEYEKCGWKLTWYYPIDNKHRNCFWHGGDYASAEKYYRGHNIVITYGTYGDVEGNLADKDGRWLDSFKDRGNNGYRHDVGCYIKSDKGLLKAIEEDRLQIDYGNCNEMLVTIDGEQDEFGIVSDDDDIIKSVWSPEELEPFLDENYIEEEQS